MVDFTEEIQRQKAIRSPFKKALSYSDFCDLKDTVNSGITGISDITLKSELYKTAILFDGVDSKEGQHFGTVRIETDDEDGYDTLLARINDEIAEEAFGSDVETHEDVDARSWTLTYSAKDGEDVFSMVFAVGGDSIKLTIDNYLNDSTKTKMETWADTIAILSDGVED